MFLLLLVAMLLAACTGATSTPTAEPTQAPPTAQPSTPTSVPTETNLGDAEMLTGTTWMWTGFTDPTQQFDVETPENYTLTFNEDNTVNIVADCNNASGTYTVAQSISIEVGPMTMAACPPDSLSDDYIKYLGSAAIYFFEDGNLYIDLFADGGTMAFTPAGDMEMTGDLTANPWQWVSFTNPMEQYTIDNPENYVLTFNEDGTVNIVADCNNASGAYTADSSSLMIEVGPMTMATCPPDSRSDDFVKYLGFAAIYFFEDGNLYIDLFADGGTMEFTAAETEPAAGSSLTTGTWRWELFTSPVEQLEVPEPDKYTIALIDSSDMAVIYADCNTIIGTYTVEGQRIKIELGATTLAECGPESLSDRFLSYLQEEVIYDLVDGRLVLDLPADGGTLGFGIYDEQAALQAQYRVNSWDEALEKALAPENCDAPGGVLLADTPQGRYLKAQGLASSQDQTPLQATDRLQIGSNTKSFTTLLALLLQEDGVWSLDDPLSKWLPDQAAKIQNGDKITLRMLGQNHTGLPDYADAVLGSAIEGDTFDQASLEKGYTPEELVDIGLQLKEPAFAPGEGWEYSTTNFILLGMAIEAATGKPLDQLYQERIFDPLGMDDSTLLNGLPEENSFVHGYWTMKDSEVVDVTSWNGSQGWAGGGIVSTAEDMAKYAAALASGSIFSDPASLEQMIAFGDGVVGGFDGYGLGVGRWSREPFAWGHAGQTPGFQSLFAIYPELDARVVFLTNSGSCHIGLYFMNILNASPDLFTQELP